MYSFDIYDTLITRTVKTPKGIFLLMGEIIKEQYSDINQIVKNNFADIRVISEEIARGQKDKEITLEDIYDVMSLNYGITEKEKNYLMKLELNCEINNTVEIPQNVKKVIRLFDSGERVILVSDMYLRKEEIHKIFEKVAPRLKEIPLYISSEAGVTKAGGMLFSYIRKKEKASYDEWTHIGDNVISDQSIPGLFGIEVEPYRLPYLDTWMENLLNFCQQKDSVIHQYLGGLNRISRFTDCSDAYRLGYSFFSIILYSYVNWIINTALQKDIKRLFFISRDGYVLKKITDIVIGLRELPLRTYELYGSRKAWTPENSEERKQLEKYIKQELGELVEDCGLVDTQGTGRSVAHLSEICGYRIQVFYFVLLERKKNKNIMPYVYSAYSGKGLIEALCRAPYGSTVGYCDRNGRIEPVFSEWNSSVWEKAGLDDYVRGVEAFTQDFTNLCLRNNYNPPMIGIAERILHYCAECPDQSIADFIGDIPHETDNENENYLYAPKLNARETYRVEVERTTQAVKEFYTGVDLEFSYFRMNNEEKNYLAQCKKEYWKNRGIHRDENCPRVVIYGYGKYGRDLVHRVYHAPYLKLIAVVDANNKRYEQEEIKIEEIRRLKREDYDVIGISLYDENIGEEVAGMLAEAGIPREKIYLRRSFIKHFIEDLA